MVGMVALLSAALGTGLLAVLVARVRRELPPTRAAFERLDRDLRPALVELRAETARTRAEISRHLRER